MKSEKRRIKVHLKAIIRIIRQEIEIGTGPASKILSIFRFQNTHLSSHEGFKRFYITGMEPLLHCIQHHHKKIGCDAQWLPGGGSYQARDGKGGEQHVFTNVRISTRGAHFPLFWTLNFGRLRTIFQVNGSAQWEMDPALKESREPKGDWWPWRRIICRWL